MSHVTPSCADVDWAKCLSLAAPITLQRSATTTTCRILVYSRLFLNIDQLAWLARKYKIVFKLFVFEAMITTRQTLFIIRFSIITKVCVPMYLNYLASRSTSRYWDPQFFAFGLSPVVHFLPKPSQIAISFAKEAKRDSQAHCHWRSHIDTSDSYIERLEKEENFISPKVAALISSNYTAVQLQYGKLCLTNRSNFSEQTSTLRDSSLPTFRL